ncbi:MAG: response regulator [Elusimicrobiota bacterium]|jgi:DNA-binding response OmpR family regulator
MACKILIVDKDEDFTVSLEHQLVGNGFDVTRVPDGMMGMQCALRHKPDLIIADLQCPAGGGLSMLTNLRRSVLTRNIPVLILAGPGNPESKKKLLEFGMLTYMQKPFSREELLARIKQRLSSNPKIVASGDFVPPSPSPSPDNPIAPFVPGTTGS